MMISVIKLAASCIVMIQLELVTITNEFIWANNANFLYYLFFVLTLHYGLVFFFFGQEDQFHKTHRNEGEEAERLPKTMKNPRSIWLD